LTTTVRHHSFCLATIQGRSVTDIFNDRQHRATAEKVLEKLPTGDKATIVIERQTDGKMRVTSGS
jgi:hypothetical protein